MKLYVGNLSYSTNQDTLYNEFGAHGNVEEVAVITDRETGRPRGFAFVTMNNDQEARAAIEALNGAEVDGRTITVNEARPKTDRGGGGGAAAVMAAVAAAAGAAAAVAASGKPAELTACGRPPGRRSRSQLSRGLNNRRLSHEDVRQAFFYARRRQRTRRVAKLHQGPGVLVETKSAAG